MRSEPAWLHERNNDPYGTPNSHSFWEEVELSLSRVGDYKIFERGGVWYGYNTRQNFWMRFGSEAEAISEAQKPYLDMWA